METLKIKYVGDLRTEAFHIASGANIITDAPLDNHGKGEAFSPTDLLCSALGSCMLTIMGIAANTHQFKLIGAEVKVTKIMVSQPRRVGEIIVDFHFPDLSFSDKQLKILEQAAYTCPVYLSLHPEIIKTIRFNF
jgi:uncharacterized OsmC-like protein